MRRHADAEQIARGWDRVADSAGNFQRMGVPSARQFDGYTVMDVPLKRHRRVLLGLGVRAGGVVVTLT